MMVNVFLAFITALCKYMKQIVRRKIIGARKRFQHRAKNIPFVIINDGSSLQSLYGISTQLV
jgi:hypothetical protein